MDGAQVSCSRTISLSVFFSKSTTHTEEGETTHGCFLTHSFRGDIGALLHTFHFSECCGLNYVSSYQFLAEILTPNVMVFGDGDFGRLLGHDGGALTMG